MLAKSYRLTKTKDFDKVMKGGKAVYAPILMLKFIKNELNYSRFGVIVSNKISKKAVKRNLVRRRIREIIRLIFKQIKPGYDFVIIASPKIIIDDKVIKYSKIEQVILNLLKKVKLI